MAEAVQFLLAQYVNDTDALVSETLQQQGTDNGAAPQQTGLQDNGTLRPRRSVYKRGTRQTTWHFLDNSIAGVSGSRNDMWPTTTEDYGPIMRRASWVEAPIPVHDVTTGGFGLPRTPLRVLSIGRGLRRDAHQYLSQEQQDLRARPPPPQQQQQQQQQQRLEYATGEQGQMAAAAAAAVVAMSPADASIRGSVPPQGLSVPRAGAWGPTFPSGHRAGRRVASRLQLNAGAALGSLLSEGLPQHPQCASDGNGLDSPRPAPESTTVVAMHGRSHTGDGDGWGLDAEVDILDTPSGWLDVPYAAPKAAQPPATAAITAAIAGSDGSGAGAVRSPCFLPQSDCTISAVHAPAPLTTISFGAAGPGAAEAATPPQLVEDMECNLTSAAAAVASILWSSPDIIVTPPTSDPTDQGAVGFCRKAALTRSYSTAKARCADGGASISATGLGLRPGLAPHYHRFVSSMRPRRPLSAHAGRLLPIQIEEDGKNAADDDIAAAADEDARKLSEETDFFMNTATTGGRAALSRAVSKELDWWIMSSQDYKHETAAGGDGSVGLRRRRRHWQRGGSNDADGTPEAPWSSETAAAVVCTSSTFGAASGTSSGLDRREVQGRFFNGLSSWMFMGRLMPWRFATRGYAWGNANRYLPVFLPSKWRDSWDVLLLVMLLYTAAVVPLQAGFEAVDHFVLDVMDWVIFGIFWLDIGVQFRSAYVSETGELVRNTRQIARHYCHTWLLIDLASSLPWTEVLHAMLADKNKHTGSLLTLLRLVRLLKLFRLLRFLDRFRYANMLRLGRLFGLMMLVAHWTCCAWHGLSEWLEGWPWLFDELRRTGDDSFLSEYSLALYSAFVLVVGSDNLQAHNNVERVFFICMLIIGAVIYALVVSNMAVLAANLNALSSRYKLKSFLVADALRYVGAPQPFRDRVAGYYDFLARHEHPGPEADAFLAELPRGLVDDIKWCLFSSPFYHLPLFAGCDEPFMAALQARLTLVAFTPGEEIFREGDAGQHMYLVRQGAVLLRSSQGDLMRVVLPGEAFSELALLPYPLARRQPCTAVAGRATDLAVLAGRDLAAACREHPQSGALVQERLMQMMEDRIQGTEWTWFIEKVLVPYQLFGESYGPNRKRSSDGGLLLAGAAGAAADSRTVNFVRQLQERRQGILTGATITAVGKDGGGGDAAFADGSSRGSFTAIPSFDKPAPKAIASSDVTSATPDTGAVATVTGAEAAGGSDTKLPATLQGSRTSEALSAAESGVTAFHGATVNATINTTAAAAAVPTGTTLMSTAWGPGPISAPAAAAADPGILSATTVPYPSAGQSVRTWSSRIRRSLVAAKPGTDAAFSATGTASGAADSFTLTNETQNSSLQSQLMLLLPGMAVPSTDQKPGYVAVQPNAGGFSATAAATAGGAAVAKSAGGRGGSGSIPPAAVSSSRPCSTDSIASSLQLMRLGTAGSASIRGDQPPPPPQQPSQPPQQLQPPQPPLLQLVQQAGFSNGSDRGDQQHQRTSGDVQEPLSPPAVRRQLVRGGDGVGSSRRLLRNVSDLLVNILDRILGGGGAAAAATAASPGDAGVPTRENSFQIRVQCHVAQDQVQGGLESHAGNAAGTEHLMGARRRMSAQQATSYLHSITQDVAMGPVAVDDGVPWAGVNRAGDSECDSAGMLGKGLAGLGLEKVEAQSPDGLTAPAPAPAAAEPTATSTMPLAAGGVSSAAVRRLRRSEGSNPPTRWLTTVQSIKHADGADDVGGASDKERASGGSTGSTRTALGAAGFLPEGLTDDGSKGGGGGIPSLILHRCRSRGNGRPFSGVDGGGATSSHSVPRLSHDATEFVVSPLSPSRLLLSRNAGCAPSSHSYDGGDTCGTVGGAPPAIAMTDTAFRSPAVEPQALLHSKYLPSQVASSSRADMRTQLQSSLILLAGVLGVDLPKKTSCSSGPAVAAPTPSPMMGAGLNFQSRGAAAASSSTSGSVLSSTVPSGGGGGGGGAAAPGIAEMLLSQPCSRQLLVGLADAVVRRLGVAVPAVQELLQRHRSEVGATMQERMGRLLGGVVEGVEAVEQSVADLGDSLSAANRRLAVIERSALDAESEGVLASGLLRHLSRDASRGLDPPSSEDDSTYGDEDCSGGCFLRSGGSGGSGGGGGGGGGAGVMNGTDADSFTAALLRLPLPSPEQESIKKSGSSIIKDEGYETQLGFLTTDSRSVETRQPFKLGLIRPISRNNTVGDSTNLSLDGGGDAQQTVAATAAAETAMAATVEAASRMRQYGSGLADRGRDPAALPSGPAVSVAAARRKSLDASGFSWFQQDRRNSTSTLPPSSWGPRPMSTSCSGANTVAPDAAVVTASPAGTRRRSLRHSQASKETLGGNGGAAAAASADLEINNLSSSPNMAFHHQASFPSILSGFNGSGRQTQSQSQSQAQLLLRGSRSRRASIVMLHAGLLAADVAVAGATTSPTSVQPANHTTPWQRRSSFVAVLDDKVVQDGGPAAGAVAGSGGGGGRHSTSSGVAPSERPGARRATNVSRSTGAQLAQNYPHIRCRTSTSDLSSAALAMSPGRNHGGMLSPNGRPASSGGHKADFRSPFLTYGATVASNGGGGSDVSVHGPGSRRVAGSGGDSSVHGPGNRRVAGSGGDSSVHGPGNRRVAGSGGDSSVHGPGSRRGNSGLGDLLAYGVGNNWPSSRHGSQPGSRRASRGGDSRVASRRASHSSVGCTGESLGAESDVGEATETPACVR